MLTSPPASLNPTRPMFGLTAVGLLIAATLTLSPFSTGDAFAQQAPERGNNAPRQSPNAMVGQTFGTTEAVITYGRPLARGREIFGGLVPFDAVWRTGANESTNLTTSGELVVTDADGSEHRVPAGVHSIYTIPAADGQWTVILNSATSWGTQYDEASDVLRFSASASEAPYTEQFTIQFEQVDATSGALVLLWETTRVAIPVSAPGAP